MSDSPFSSNLNAEQLRQIFDQCPVPLSLYDATGLQVAMNAANAAMFDLRVEEWIGQFNMVTNPQLRATGSAERHAQVMRGETVIVPAHSFTARASGHQADAADERWAEATYAPLRDAAGNVTHLLAILRDVTNEMSQRTEIETARAEIASQRMMIDSLSTPVVQVWDEIIAMSLVGTIDSRRAMQITESLLTAIEELQAECLIIDITGVPIMDTQVARYLLQAAYASKLLGCEVALVGISAEMAQTLVQLGVDFQTLTTMANLKAGIAWAFERRGLIIGERR
jgi:anti-anti-sigma factor